MWVKRALVVLPLFLLAFLAQSLFWVPAVETAAQNEFRENRVVLYMGGDPKDMNPWSSTTTNDSTITFYIYEGLLRYDKDFNIEPWLSEYASIMDEVVAPVPAGMGVEDFEAWVRKHYPGQVRKFEKAQDAGTPAVLTFPEGKPAENASEDARLVKYTPPATVRMTLARDPVPGEIVSAIDAEFAASIYAERRAQAFSAHGTTKPEELTENAVLALAKAVKVPAPKHSPVVEMRITPGVHWTDGPFYTAPDRTWVVSVNGDQVAPVEADSADAAMAMIRDRLELGAKDQLKAWTYTDRFGEEGGPWWGKGRELQAIDAKTTIELIKNPDFSSPRLSSWMDVSEVRTFADDPYKLQVVYNRLFSPALSNLVGDIIPYHVWNVTAWRDEAIRKARGPHDLGIKPADYNVMRALPTTERDFRHRPPSIGSMVLEPLNGQERPLWKISQRVTLRRNEFYRLRKPEFKFVDYYIFDPALGLETSEVVFNSGGMDAYQSRDFQVSRYREMTDRFNVLQRQTTTYTYLGYNCRKEPLANPVVRKALTMAVDAEQIIKYVIYEQGKRIAGPAYPVLPWYNENYRVKHTWLTGPNKGKTTDEAFLPYDPVEAKALLLQSGFTEDASGGLLWKGAPWEVSLINASGGGSRQDICLLARENWQKLGFKVDYKEYEWNVFISQYIHPGNFDIMVLGWSGGLNFDKRQLFHSRFTPPSGLNFVGYNNPKADALMDKILSEYDPEKQIKLSHGIFDMIADDVPYAFLYSPNTTTVLDRHIVWRKPVGKNPDGSLILENRPVNHQHITGAKQPLAFFVPELQRLDAIPDFTDADRRN